MSTRENCNVQAERIDAECVQKPAERDEKPTERNYVEGCSGKIQNTEDGTVQKQETDIVHGVEQQKQKDNVEKTLKEKSAEDLVKTGKVTDKHCYDNAAVQCTDDEYTDVDSVTVNIDDNIL